ncbi:hypothetical protein N7468_002311 [Penicillium chermesinum]|uniref:C3H1-type domain-containing protein n=1 Tax=Penicillium chermesinum TaxID=63820 RepID=A0A9W9TYA8_9EURO|nr:uncharacterized protein N7468_002311 [Penicillium chermesinum]KAJ5247328.1 hypothetical protein N7468_002311 [Penicillium chermesinum]
MLADNINLRAQFEAFTKRENEKNGLIDPPKAELNGQNMFQMLQTYENKVRVLELELNSEKRYRVSTQKSLGQWAKYGSSQNDFVVVLVDGDGAIFHDDFLSKPREGATDASRKLTQAVRDSLKDERLIDSENITILVRIFANMNDLARTLHLSRVISGRSDLSTFAEQFTTSRGEYDFINVGPGKENADSKMRGNFQDRLLVLTNLIDMLKHYYSNYQCKKIFFAGCHDNGYLNDLQKYTSDEESRERITLVETTPAQPSFRTMLTFPIIRFDGVFRSTSLSMEDSSQPSSPAAPIIIPKTAAITAPSWRRDSASSTTTTSSTSHHRTSSISPSPPSAFPNISISGNGGMSVHYPTHLPAPTYASACGPGSQKNISLTSPSETRAVLYNEHRERIDPPNKKPADQPAFDSYFAKLAKVKTAECRGFCNYRYLQGQCRRGAMCHNEHDVVLSEREIAVHRYRARLGLCTNGPTCSDYDCFFSHHCPFVPNCTAQTCKFEVHLEAKDMVVW